VPLPQTGHRGVPISKHVSQSRHSAVRPNGKCRVLTVSRALESLTLLRRFGELLGCSIEGAAGLAPCGVSRSSNGGASHGIVKARWTIRRLPEHV
jgi:hypothetical protein